MASRADEERSRRGEDRWARLVELAVTEHPCGRAIGGLPTGVVGVRNGTSVEVRGSFPTKQGFGENFELRVTATSRGWRREATVHIHVRPPI